MPTVQFKSGGQTHRATVPESFFALDDEEKKRKLLSLIGAPAETQAAPTTPALPTAVPTAQPTEEGEGIWDATKDVVSKGYGAIPDPIQTGLETVGGGMMGALHHLGRPQSAVAAGLYSLQQQNEGVEAENWKADMDQVLEAMKKGFTYEDEKRIQDLMTRANPEWVKAHPILSTITGFGGDVLTDPLLYVPIFGWAGLAVKGLSKALSKTAVGRGMIEAADNPVLRAFNVYTGDKKKARDLYVQMLDDIRGSQGIIARGQKIEKVALKDSAKRLGIKVEDLERQVLREAEGPPTVDFIKSKIPPNLTGAARAKASQEADDMVEMFGNFFRDEAADLTIKGGGRVKGANVQDVMLRAGDLGIEGYVPHLLAKAGRRQTDTLMDTFRHHPSMIKRKHGGTIEETNLNYGDNFFVKDVPTIKGARAARHAHVVAGKNFLKDVSEQLGRLADEAPEGWVPVHGVEGVLFDPKLAPFINNMYKIVNDPKELGKFLKFTDGATRWWKMWALGLRPAYHARNVVGNLWNAYNIGGMSPHSVKKFTQAGIIQRQSLRGKGFSGTVHLGRKFKKSDGSDFTREEVWNFAMEDGVLNHGQYGADISRGIERYAIDEAPRNAAQRLGEWVTPSTKNRLLRGGFATGRTLENNARLALYLDTLAKTGSRKAARANVKKSLFDYGDLSPFEQDVMKRFIPFYTWSRKNIPAQIEALIKNPQRAAKIHHLIDNIQYGIDTPSLDEVNEFIRGRDPVFVDKFMEGGGGDVHNVITLMNWLPLMDVDRLLDWKPMREGKVGQAGTPFPTLLAEMTNPYLKSMVEWGLNYDIYRRRDIQDYPNQKVDFVGVRMPVHLAKLAQNLIMFAELDRLNPKGMFGEATRTEGAVPERTKSWAGATRESRIDQPMSMRLLQYLVGLRPYEVKEDAKKWETLKRFKDYRELMNLLRKAAMSGKVDTMEEIKRAMRDMTRVMEGK